MLKEEELLNFMSSQDLNFAKSLNTNRIRFISVNAKNNTCKYLFNFDGYEQEIITSNNNIINSYCDCYRHSLYGSCYHVNAILYNFYDLLKSGDASTVIKKISHNFAEELRKVNERKNKSPIRKQCFIDVDLKTNYGSLLLNLKIGENRKYILSKKARSFFDAYYSQNGEVTFGKNFSYSYSDYYFSDEDKLIINYATNLYNYDFELDPNSLRVLFSLLNNKDITVNGIKCIGIKPFDIPINLDKQNKEYELSFDFDTDNMLPLTSNYAYIFYNNYIYELNENQRLFFGTMLENHIQKFIFDNKKDITNTIIPMIKDNIKATENVDDIVIVKKPKTKLYFDLAYNKVYLDIKFDYKGNIYSYFDKKTSEYRDSEFEEAVFNEMINYGFIHQKKRLSINDDEKIGFLLDEYLDTLSQKYEVFTSEKLKNISTIKNTNIKSNFSIGKNNIMKFDFDLGEINQDELLSVLNSLKQKKKYYKLKSGNYLNLEDDKLNQLNNLIDDINLTKEELENGSGIIPKYKAIYLDSLKNDNYNIINTNNLFDDFISNFKKYQNSTFDFEKKDLKILRDYQKIGIKWLYNIYKCGFGSILADEMGLGKSLQTLIFIKQVIKEKKDAKILIITPTSLCYNWEKEIQKFTPNLKYKVFTNNRNLRRKEIQNSKENIFITSYGLIREDSDIYNNFEFEVCIIDEAQNIKNSQTGIAKAVKAINSKCKIALTGTPLENSIAELWSIFDFIMPGFFEELTDFNKKYNVKNFEQEDLDRINRLNKKIKPFMLRRKKKDVIKDLPDKIENNIFIDLDDEQKKIYASLVEKTKRELDELIITEGFQKSRFKILELLTRLRQCCIHPKIIFENYKGGSEKIEQCVKVIQESIENNHKMLIFSSFRTALKILEENLNKNKIKYHLIDGATSSKKRMELVSSFDTDDTHVFLIMLKAGGTGLNLTSADIVIHLDLWWNPQVENQATDRAHRIGQKNTVEVVKLITKGTIEERILELQQKKKQLADSIIDGDIKDQSIINKLTEEDIKKLLQS